MKTLSHPVVAYDIFGGAYWLHPVYGCWVIEAVVYGLLKGGRLNPRPVYAKAQVRIRKQTWRSC